MCLIRLYPKQNTFKKYSRGQIAEIEKEREKTVGRHFLYVCSIQSSLRALGNQTQPAERNFFLAFLLQALL